MLRYNRTYSYSVVLSSLCNYLFSNSEAAKEAAKEAAEEAAEEAAKEAKSNFKI